MNSLQRAVVATWVAGIASIVLMVLARNWPYIWWLLFGLAALATFLEPPLMRRVYAVAPTPQEFIASRPIWRRLLLLYVGILAVAVVCLLTFAQDLARQVGQSPLAFFSSIIFGPLLPLLVAHQIEVYRVLASAESQDDFRKYD